MQGPCCSEWPVLPPGAVVTSGPKLQLRTMSKPAPWVCVGVTPVASEGHVDSQCLVHDLRPCWSLRAILQLCHTDLSGLCCHLEPW